jgi:hypothetical protein
LFVSTIVSNPNLLARTRRRQIVMGETRILMDAAGANQFPRFYGKTGAESESVNQADRLTG